MTDVRIGTRVEGLVEGEPRPSLDEALSGFGRDSSAKEGSAICSDLGHPGACMHGIITILMYAWLNTYPGMSEVCGSMQAGVMERFMMRRDECHTCAQGRGAKEGGEAKEALCTAS
jgi:hypothetical protein